MGYAPYRRLLELEVQTSRLTTVWQLTRTRANRGDRLCPQQTRISETRLAVCDLCRQDDAGQQIGRSYLGTYAFTIDVGPLIRHRNRLSDMYCLLGSCLCEEAYWNQSRKGLPELLVEADDGSEDE